MGEKVFENKNVYFPAFIKPVIGLMLFAAIGLVSSNRFFIKDDTQKLNLQNMLIVLAAALVIGAIMGIVAMLKIPKMKITVNKKGVEVIRGKAEGFYPLKDFRGYKTTRRQKNEFGTLIFEDEDDTDDQYLLIDCEGFRWGDFKKIADCIRIFKYNVFRDGDYPTDKLEDDHYEGSDKEVYDPKKSRNQLILGVIIAIAVNAGVAWFYINKYTLSGAKDILILHGAFILVMAFICFRLYQALVKNSVISIQNLYLMPTELKINNETWPLKQIESIYITPPYLQSQEEAYRNLYIFEKDNGKRHAYFIENKPVEYDPEEKYFRLYNSMIDLCKQNRIKVEEFEP